MAKELGNELACYTSVAEYLANETIVANGKKALELTLKHSDLVDRGMQVGSHTYYVANEILEKEGL